MVTIPEAAGALRVGRGTASEWARSGKLVGAVKAADGTWLVRRSEVDRLLAEREQASEQRAARWVPMSGRTTVSGFPPRTQDPTDDR